MFITNGNYEYFTKLVEKYAESLKKQIIVSRKNYFQLIITSFKYANLKI